MRNRNPTNDPRTIKKKRKTGTREREGGKTEELAQNKEPDPSSAQSAWGPTCDKSGKNTTPSRRKSDRDKAAESSSKTISYPNDYYTYDKKKKEKENALLDESSPLVNHFFGEDVDIAAEICKWIRSVFGFNKIL